MTLTLAPMGGLANRMRAVISAYSLACEVGSDLRVAWVRDKGLNARFCDLFEPVNLFDIEEVSGWKSILYAPPMKRNLFIPKLLQSGYGQVLFDDRLAGLQLQPGQLKQMVEGKRTLIGSGLGFYPSDPSLYTAFFVPQEEIREKVEHTLAGLPSNVVGVHIRRTDNAESIRRSPLEAFVSRMSEFPDSPFYLATDSEDVRRQLETQFPGRILTSGRPASRGTLQGMMDGVAEMFILARTSCFLGSYYSSFSDIILELNGKGEIVTRS